MAFLLYFLISYPSLFYKRNWHPDPDKMVLWDISPSSSQTPGFLNKVAILASTPCLPIIGLSCGEQTKLGFGRKFGEPAMRLAV